MGVVRVLLLSFLALFCVSCHNDAEEIVDVNSGYTAVQQKALEILDGVWVSDEVRMNIEMGGQVSSMIVFPQDTIIFLTKFQLDKSVFFQIKKRHCCRFSSWVIFTCLKG